MNSRRGFLKTLAAATAGFAILPAATTYTRLWKATKVVDPKLVMNPEWVDAPYEFLVIWHHHTFREFRFDRDLHPLRYNSELKLVPRLVPA